MSKTTKQSKAEEALKALEARKDAINTAYMEEKAKAKKVAEAIMEEAVNAAIQTIEAKEKAD